MIKNILNFWYRIKVTKKKKQIDGVGFETVYPLTQHSGDDHLTPATDPVAFQEIHQIAEPSLLPPFGWIVRAGVSMAGPVKPPAGRLGSLHGWLSNTGLAWFIIVYIIYVICCLFYFVFIHSHHAYASAYVCRTMCAILLINALGHFMCKQYYKSYGVPSYPYHTDIPTYYTF